MCYTIFLEYLFQRTPPKFITKTKVIGKGEEKISIYKLLVRSLFRLIPLESFSFHFLNKGWHDLTSDTYVIKGQKADFDNA